MSEYRNIGSFAKVRRGASPRPIDNPEFFGGDVGWVRISDVTQRNNKYLRNTRQYLSAQGQSKSLRVNSGDLIMSICATVGKPMIVDMPACIHDGFVQIYDLKNADTEYLYYLLQFHEKDFEKRGQPGTQVNLNTTIVENEIVFLPDDISKQQKIAKILTAIDKLIEKTQALIDKHTAIKQGMMADLFTRGIDLTTGQLRPTVEQAPHLYKETELGWIPKEWDIESIENSGIELVDGDRGSNYPSAEDLLKEGYCVFLSANNVTKKGFSWSKIQFITEEKHNKLGTGTVISNDVVITTRGTVGNIAYYGSDLPYEAIRINSGMLILRESLIFS